MALNFCSQQETETIAVSDKFDSSMEIMILNYCSRLGYRWHAADALQAGAGASCSHSPPANKHELLPLTRLMGLPLISAS